MFTHLFHGKAEGTLSAECLSAVEAAEYSVFVASLLKNILYGKQSDKQIPINIMCDNRSLVLSVHSSTNVENKRLIIDINLLRDMVIRKEIQEFRWISTDLQLANCLTKQGASADNLYHVLNNPDKLRFDFDKASFVYN